MSEPFKLYRLQHVDSQLDQARARLNEIEAVLKDDQAVQQALQDVQAAEDISQNAARNLRRVEEEVKAQEIKIEQNQAALYGGTVSNPKELQDLQNESGALKRYLSVLEERQLESMIAFEEAETSFNSAQTRFEEVTAQAAQQNTELTQEQTELNKDVDRLEGERQAAATGIPQEDMELYNQLRESRGGIAVAKVVDKTCSACGTILSQALAQSARSPSQINRCDTCGRILYSG